MSSSTPSTRKPRARPDVVFRRVGKDWLLFDPRSRRIHVLNLSAALVWSYCTGEHAVEEIARELEDAFEKGAVEGDPVDEALERFEAAGLLVP